MVHGVVVHIATLQPDDDDDDVYLNIAAKITNHLPYAPAKKKQKKWQNFNVNKTTIEYKLVGWQGGT
jgi:hypothetical protein